jgi:hypothetical protein
MGLHPQQNMVPVRSPPPIRRGTRRGVFFLATPPAALSEPDAMTSTSASTSSRYAKHRRIGEDEEVEEEAEEEVGHASLVFL